MMAHVSELGVFFEAISDAVVVYDGVGNMVYLNVAARRLLLGNAPDGALLQQVDQRAAHVVLGDAQGQVLPQGQWPLFRILRGEVLAGALDIRVRQAGGGEVLLNVSGAPVRDATGEIIGAFCAFRDVTERRRQEQRTRDALETLLAVAEAIVLESDQAPPAMGHSAAAGGATVTRLAELICRVLGCQRVTLFGLEPGTDVLQPLAVSGLAPEQERAWWVRWGDPVHLEEHLGPALAARLRGGETLVLDLTQPFFRGRPYAEEAPQALVAPLRTGEGCSGILSLDHGAARHEYTSDEIALVGAVAKLVALVIEREQLLRQQAEARQKELVQREANRRMDEFLTLASHELKTPLTTIKANIQIMERYLSSMTAAEKGGAARNRPERMRALLERTERQVSRLDQLVNDLLDVSYMRIRPLKLDIAPCDLAVIVRRVVEEQRQMYPQRTIRLDLGAELAVPIQADAARIGRVLGSYISNAIKYAPADEPIVVGLRLEDEQVRVLVRDAGPGVPASERQRIWERFHQAAGITQQSGLGLGLYLSRMIIEWHHGEVGVQSSRGKGSTFWFTLPLRV